MTPEEQGRLLIKILDEHTSLIGEHRKEIRSIQRLLEEMVLNKQDEAKVLVGLSERINKLEKALLIKLN